MRKYVLRSILGSVACGANMAHKKPQTKLIWSGAIGSEKEQQLTYPCRGDYLVESASTGLGLITSIISE